MRHLSPIIALALFAAPLAGCGADDDAPAPPQVTTPDRCPAFSELAPRTFELLETGQLPALGRLMSERLTDAQLSALIDGVLTLIRSLSPEELTDLGTLAETPALAELAPLLLDLLRWLVAEEDAALQVGVLSDLRRMIGTCETGAGPKLLVAVATAPELPELLSGLGEILALDEIGDLLSTGEALDRTGFTVLVCNILARLVAPGFSVAGDIVQPLSGIDLLPLGEPPIAPFLDALDRLLAPDGTLLPLISDLVCCDIYGVESCSAITAQTEPLPRDPVFTWTLHALFTGTIIDAEAALSSAGGLIADPAVVETLTPLIAVSETLIADLELEAVIDSVLITLLEPETARAVIGELLMLVDAGALDELATLLDAVLNGCDPLTPMVGEGT